MTFYAENISFYKFCLHSVETIKVYIKIKNSSDKKALKMSSQLK